MSVPASPVCTNRWRGCRCACTSTYCSGTPNHQGPSAGALCPDCDGTGDALPHLAHPPNWRPSWAVTDV